MKIIAAKTAGFCMGVRRAVEMAVDTSSASAGPIHTLGPLIHNNQTLEMLKARGVQALAPDAMPGAGETVLVRAHGVPPDVQEHYRSSGCTIIDGTCPKVKTVHRVIGKYRDLGYAVIIMGDQGHAEVVGLLGYAGPAGYLIQEPADVDKLPDLKKVCLVSQTTFDKNTFDRIAAAVEKRYPDSEVVIKRTICSATERRQDETRQISRQVDAMVVVGGKNSANTLRLAKISAENAPTIHVETETEIDRHALADCRTVGITAGASTPNWMIQRVMDHIQFLDRTSRKTVKGIGLQIFDLLANLNLFAAAGGVAMYYASCYLQGYRFSWTGCTVAFLYLFSMYLWNGLTSINTTRHLGLSRNRFYHAYMRKLQGLALICIAVFLVLGFLESKMLFWLLVLATAAGTAYHVSIVPRALQKVVRYRNLKDIPTSKDLFVALAWGVVISFIPHAAAGSITVSPPAVLFFLWMFFLAYVRSIMFDLKDIEGDRIMGRETLVTILGETRTRRGISALLFILFIAIVGSSVLLFLPFAIVQEVHVLRFLFQTPTLLYAWLFMKWGGRITANRPGLFNLTGDGQFLVAGMGAWVASAVL